MRLDKLVLDLEKLIKDLETDKMESLSTYYIKMTIAGRIRDILNKYKADSDD